MRSAVSVSVSTMRRGAVGDQRAIGAAQRPGDDRVLLRDGVAELEAEILAQLRVGIVDAVAVVLGGDPRQRLRLVAVALEIELRDAAENAGEAALRVALLLAIGGVEQDVADRRAGRARSSSRRRPPARSGCCRAAISFSPMRIAAEPVAQAFSTRVAGRKRSAGVGERQRGRKALLLEAAEIADIDRADLGRRDAGIGDRRARPRRRSGSRGPRPRACRISYAPSRRSPPYTSPRKCAGEHSAPTRGLRSVKRGEISSQFSRVVE